MSAQTWHDSFPLFPGSVINLRSGGFHAMNLVSAEEFQHQAGSG
jgi:hypothetical protein